MEEMLAAKQVNNFRPHVFLRREHINGSKFKRPLSTKNRLVSHLTKAPTSASALKTKINKKLHKLSRMSVSYFI